MHFLELLYSGQQTFCHRAFSSVMELKNPSAMLRTVPTFATTHTFCASRDTRVSHGWWRDLKLCGESRT